MLQPALSLFSLVALVAVPACSKSETHPPVREKEAPPPGPSAPAPEPSAPATEPEASDLTVHGAGAAGGPTLVLLHGYGASGDDLFALGGELVGERGWQVLAPEGPLAVGHGRGWWPLGGADWAEHVARANGEVHQLLDEIIAQGTRPDQIVIGGFSQGAIVAVDVALSREPPLGGVAALSGSPPKDWRERVAGLETTALFFSHGDADRVIPIADQEPLVQALEAQGTAVRFERFSGGHAIPPAIRTALGEFVVSVLGASGE